MAQSPEYPDLQWIPPKSWTNANRTAVQLVVIHDTEGSSHSQSAEDGARYNQQRDDGTSAHYFHDNNSTVQCVRTEDIAHTARRQGNRRGIHHELCARAFWPTSRWLSADYGRPMLERAAKQTARDCRKWGIPARKLTVQQVRDGVKGICSHHDITRAFPEDNGDHTDPGPNFPWSEFIAMVQAHLNPPKPTPPEDDVPLTPEQDDFLVATTHRVNAIVWDADEYDTPWDTTEGNTRPNMLKQRLNAIDEELAAVRQDIAGLRELLAQAPQEPTA